MCAMIFDSHAHYDDERFDENRDELLLNMANHDVCGIIHQSINLEGSRLSVEYTKKYPNFYAMVGIHPQEVNANTQFNSEDFLPLIENKKVVGIGEIGLDYYWDTTFKENQKKILKEQIDFANANNLPISFHDREAHADSLEILKEMKPKGVVHCFSGSVEMANEIIKQGMYIGVGGVVTFKNAKKLCEVVENIPIEKILLETDAPYLAPEPFRSKLNHSGYIEFIARKVAEIKKIEYSDVLKITTENSKKLFNI